jgi:hypothetical protein
MSSQNPPVTLPVRVAPGPQAEDDASKGLFGPRRSDELVLKDIPVARLQEQLSALSQSIEQLLDAPSPDPKSRLQLSQLTVQVEITASGGINLIGTATVGATAALTLTFSR